MIGRSRWSSISAALRRRLLYTSSSSATEAEALPLYRRLSALEREGSAKLTMNKWLREGKSVRASDVVTYAKRLRKYGHHRHALELMEWMDTRGMNMSYSNYALRMLLIAKVSGIESAEKYFNYLPEPAKNHLTYGALISIYCAGEMTDKAISLFVIMKDLGYASDTLVYNKLMELFVKTGQPGKVPILLTEMKKTVRMDSFTYSILVTHFATTGDIEAVDRIMQLMDTAHPSCQRWPAYSNLASVYISTGCLEKAKSSLKRLEEVMDCMDRDAYHHLVSLYSRLGNSTEVKRVWTSLVASLKATNRSYLVLLQALDRLDDFDALEQHFRQWDSNYNTYHIVLVNVMFGSYLRRSMVREARTLLEHATAKGAEPDWRTFKLFTDYYVANGDIESALKFSEIAAAKLKSWKLDKTTADSILLYLEEKKDTSRAMAFRRSLKEHYSDEIQRPSTSIIPSLVDLDEQSLMMDEDEAGM